MAPNKIYVGDVGTEILVDCQTDIVTATVKQIRVRKPSGAEGLWWATIIGSIGSVSVSVGGSGYVVNDILTVTQGGGFGGKVKVTSIGSGGVVTGVVISEAGNNYEVANNVSTTGGTGSGCRLNILSLASATILKYVIQTGDLNEAGLYTIQAKVKLPAWEGLGESVSFEVYDRFK